MLLQLRRWIPERPIVLVVDSGYAALEFLGSLANRKTTDHCNYAFAPGCSTLCPGSTPVKGQMGRPRRKGARLPSLQKRLLDRNTVWRKITVPHWYSSGPRTIQVATGTAVWYRVGLPVVPIRWILIRDPQQKFRSQALLSTDLEIDPGQAIQWFVLRWQLETTFAEVRSKIGVETPWTMLPSF